MYTRLTPPRRENHVEETIELQIAELSRMTVGQLKQKYIEVFGEETRSNNRQFLFLRIAWRIQALAEGAFPNALAAAPSRSQTTRTSGFALPTRSSSIQRHS